MNKKIISMAVAAALVAPMAAQAEVKVSGRVALELTSSNNVMDFVDHGMNRLEFVGTQGDWTAKLGLDMRQLGNNAAQWTGQRDAWVAVKMGGGSLTMGRASTVVANLEGDKFIGTFLQMRGAAVDAGQFGSGSFNNEVIQYKTKVGGANLGVEYVLSADADASVNTGHYAVALKGKAGSLGYYVGMNNGAGAANNMKVGASMEMGGMNVRLGMDNYAASKLNLGVDMKMAGGTLDITFADKGNNAASSYTRIAYMTKAAGADLHAGYAMNGTDGADTFGVGVTVKF